MPGAISTPLEANADHGPPAHVRGIYHITQPRSASNLFQNMMAKQPGFQNSGYKLFHAGFATLSGVEHGPLSAWPEEKRQKLYETFKAAFETLEDELEDAEKNGKKVFIKEHAVFTFGPDRIFASLYPSEDAHLEPCTLHQRNASPAEEESRQHTNPSSLPDAFLLSLQPIFQIRHPALMYPSAIRAQRSVKMGGNPDNRFGHAMLTLRHSRKLYDWYLEHGTKVGITPCVIDADDLMKDPAAVRRLCLQTGLDPETVQYEWEERKVDDPLIARFLSTLNASRGILPGLTAEGLDVEAEKKKWVDEFGKEAGEALARRVDESMADYEYLWERRTTSGGKVDAT